jgi:hypothetical protein
VCGQCEPRFCFCKVMSDDGVEVELMELSAIKEGACRATLQEGAPRVLFFMLTLDLIAGSAQGWALSTLFSAAVMQPCLNEIARRMGPKLLAFPCFADNVEAVINQVDVEEYLNVSGAVLRDARSFGLKSDFAYFPGLKAPDEEGNFVARRRKDGENWRFCFVKGVFRFAGLSLQ